MYAFESSPRGKLFHVLTAGSFVLVLLLFGFSGMEGISYPFIYQTTAIVLMTVGIYLLVRYVLKIYRYEILDSGIRSAEGTAILDLVITEITGQKQKVVTRVALRDIHDVQTMTRKEYKERENEVLEGKTVYRYTNRPFEPISCYLSVPVENSVVAIPVDGEMIRCLRRHCSTTHEGDEK